MKKITLSFLMLFGAYAALLAQQKVGINVTSPSETLHVDSTIKIGKSTAIEASTPGRKNLLKFGDGNFVTVGEEQSDDKLYVRYGDLIFFKSANSVGNGYIGVQTEAPTAALDVNGTFRLRSGTPAAGKVLTSDASGNATWQSPAGAGIGFRGELGTDVAVTSAATPYKVTAYTEIFDNGGAFDGTNGTFTAPSTGVYSFTATINWNSPPAGSGTIAYILRFRLNTTNIIDQTNTIVPFLANYGVGTRLTSVCRLNAGDIVHVETDFSTTSTLSISGNGATASSFSGVKLY